MIHKIGGKILTKGKFESQLKADAEAMLVKMKMNPAVHLDAYLAALNKHLSDTGKTPIDGKIYETIN